MDSNIVITGISGRYPECENIDEFAKALFEGVNLITEDDRRYPVGQFNTPGGLGKIPEIDKFDAAYFNIHPKQANVMDPRQRILHEVIYESIIDAGYNPQELRGSNTGVYVGICAFPNMEELRQMKSDGYINVGACLGLSANRASYCFDFRGPSYAMETACSSSLCALVNAVNDMKNGIIDSAIVGGAHLLLHPHETLEFTKLNVLALDSKCKVFGASRDGYVRSEAIVSVFLQRRDASRRIYATVLGAGSNADGYKIEGITFPSSDSQAQLMKDVHAKAGIHPDDVVYVEPHGTGTPVGDSQELKSLVQIFCDRRSNPLYIGSVKSNIGHTEITSGLCSISKALIAMESGRIPANLHADHLDEELPGIKDGKVKVVTENMPWTGGVMGVKSLGFGGTNAYVVLKSNLAAKTDTLKRSNNRLVQASGRTMEAVNYFIDGIEKNQNDAEFLALLDEVHKMNIEGHSFRGYTILGDNPRREVDRYAEARPIWFIYSGMGSQWCGAARDLMKIEVFRNTIKRCALALEPYNIDLVDILTGTSPNIFDNMTNRFCAITAIQVALTDVLYSLDIVPDNIAGHSMGEVGCSYADGQITPEQAILMSYARGYASESVKLPLGQMATVGLSKEECEKLLPKGVFIACQNGKENVTITGPMEPTVSFLKKLSSQGVFTRIVDTTDIAYHSKYVADAEPLLLEFLEKVLPNPKPRSHKWISSSVPADREHENWAKYNCAMYHRNNFCNPVLFDKIYAHVPENAIVIEVAPHGLLLPILKREMGPKITTISLMNRTSEDNEHFFISSIGNIFLSGGQPNLRKLYSEVSFPVSRGTKTISPLVKWDHGVSWFVPYWKNTDTFGEVVTVNISDEEYAFLEGHCIDGRVLMPATGYLELVWRVFSRMHLKSIETCPVIIENIRLKRTTVLPSNTDVKFLVNIMTQSGNFEIFEGGSVVATGKVSIPKDIGTAFSNPNRSGVPPNNYLHLQKRDFYKEFNLRRYMYKGIFQGIKECDVYGLQGVIEWEDNFTGFLDAMLQLGLIENFERQLYLPSSIEKLIIDPVEHIRQASEKKELPIFSYPAHNIIKSGAIEIIGMKTSIAARRQKTQENPVLETYEFIPYENSVESKFDFDTSLRTCLQIIWQNTKGQNKKFKIRILNENNNFNLREHIEEILLNQVMIEVEYCKYDLNDNVEDNSHNIIIITEEVEGLNMEALLDNLDEDGFILYLGNLPKTEMHKLQIVYQVVTTECSIYLLRPYYPFPTRYGVVNVRTTDFDWLNKIQELINNQTEVIYLFSQGEHVSGIVGFVQCLLTEPYASKFRAVLVEDTDVNIFSMDDELYLEQLSKGLTINVLKDSDWGTFVHLPLKPLENRDVEDASIGILVPGDLSTLSWVQRSPHYERVGPKSELVHVYYSALNFKDVMVATGKLQLPRGNEATAPEIKIGLEYSGITAGGRKIMGLLNSDAISLQVINDPIFSWDVPDGWSLEEAATVPCVYATCYYALIIRGQMKPGDSILIHAGSGGIGMAAISIALSMNCIVYTTVGSQDKRDYLKKLFPQLRDENIGNSRSISFRRVIMENTNGKGVDIILNSLSAEFFQESLKCIAVRGRFLEIGAVDLHDGTSIDSSVFVKNCSFHSIFLDDLIGQCFDVNNAIKSLINEGIKSGAVRPLPRTVFDETEVENAFRFLSSGKHKGKVLIRLRNEDSLASPLRTISAIPKVYFAPDKSYILVGGLGGFGLEIAEWMIRRGAKNIVLNGRRNISNGYQSFCLRKWKRFNGVTVKINLSDTTSLKGATELVADAQQLGPVAGVLNMALVLRSALFENQTKEMYEDVFRSKIISGQNMDIVTRDLCPALEHFIVFSTTSCGRGNYGQSNYGMANSALERLIEQRNRENLPALAIQWGPIGDVGYLADSGLPDKLYEYMLGQNLYSCLNAFETFMLQQAPVVSSLVLAKRGQASSTGVSKTTLEAIAHILGIQNVDLVDETVSLSKLGLDSLMIAEIKQTLYRNYQIDLNADGIRDLTFCKLKEIDASRNTKVNGQSTEHSKETNGYISKNFGHMFPKETVVELKQYDGNKQIIFFVHPIEGYVEMFRTVAEQLKSTVYGLQSTPDADCDRIQDCALCFIKQIKKIQPAGPYLLCGYSYGAALAFEMGIQLERNGEEVTLICIDGSPAYVKKTLEDRYKMREKSTNRMQVAILVNSSSDMTNVHQEKVLELLENTVGWERRLKVISELISNETGLDSIEIAGSVNRFYRRCYAGCFYEPDGILKGSVLLIRQDDGESMLSDDYDLYKICKQEVEVIKVKGDHQSILREENARLISAEINNKLVQ